MPVSHLAQLSTRANERINRPTNHQKFGGTFGCGCSWKKSRRQSRYEKSYHHQMGAETRVIHDVEQFSKVLIISRWLWAQVWSWMSSSKYVLIMLIWITMFRKVLKWQLLNEEGATKKTMITEIGKTSKPQIWEWIAATIIKLFLSLFHWRTTQW